MEDTRANMRAPHASLARRGLSLTVLALFLAGCAAQEAPPTAAPATAARTTAPATAAPTAAATAAPTAAAAAPAAGNVILAKVPNAPPRATPSPRPAGVTAPPAPTPPPAKIVPIYAQWDTVTAGAGESKYNVDANLTCVKSSVFSRGMHIVWRVEFVDTATGKVLQATDMRTAVLKVGTEEITMRYGRHGALDTSPWFWTGAWDVPPTHPLGILSWSFNVTTTGGKTAAIDDHLAVGAPTLAPGSNAVWIVP